MIEASKSHLVSIRLSILLVMLGTCVFLWGFGYKLSLYDLHEQTLHRIPEAKLLSKNEDARAADSIQRALASAASRDQLQPVSFVVAIAPAVSMCTRTRKFDRRELEAVKAPSAVSFGALYFRPPPIHFAS